MQYHCSSCDMSVKALVCAKCNSELVDDVISLPDGKKVKVAKCPKEHGKIKSPQCCGHDMQCELQ